MSVPRRRVEELIQIRLNTAIAAIIMLSSAALAQPTEPQIIAGGEVIIANQRHFGLVTVSLTAGSFGCSGTLLNRFWVLTADHCITTDGQSGGPAKPFANVPITAAWLPGTVRTPTRYVRYFASNNVDVALIFLGAGDFGPTDARFLTHGQIPDGAVVTSYGQGILRYAYRDSAGMDHPTTGAGTYRRAQFNVSRSGYEYYDLAANAAGQVIGGGDSGGPDFLMINNVPTSISGVHSGCRIPPGGCLSGHDCVPPSGIIDWFWVTRIDVCWSASISRIRADINATTGEYVTLAPVNYLLNN